MNIVPFFLAGPRRLVMDYKGKTLSFAAATVNLAEDLTALVFRYYRRGLGVPQQVPRYLPKFTLSPSSLDPLHITLSSLSFLSATNNFHPRGSSIIEQRPFPFLPFSFFFLP